MADLSHRKAKAKVQIVAKDGKPAANTNVTVNQIDHEFLFGCGAFETLPYTNGVTVHNGNGSLTKKSPDGADRAVLEDRMNKWLNLFNYGTLPFYWGGFEPEEGKPNTDQLMSAAKFLRSKGVAVKGHPLCWHTGCVPWLMNYDNATILKKQLERIRREVGNFKGVIDMWDVINEVVIMPVYDKYDNAITRICKEKGRVALVREVFKAAYETNPEGTFLINDFNMSSNYEILIDGCLNSGAKINTIGLQSHQHQGIWGKEKQDEVLSRFEYFGLPIHFTENTIVAGPLVAPEITDLQDAHYDDDAATPELEEMQADALEQMYRNLFENHPLVKAITNWDYGDGAWLNAPSGVIRKDGSLKPSYNRLHKLIKEEWHTKLELKTDAEGFINVEGFKGKYEVCFADKKLLFDLTDGASSIKLSE
ncbi:MAG: endo-1,4-beta-xylanase [Spirochaetaceae bacterium]|nr:endo-1,4-beta-xylanase [Spirochaetaceae bacterium]